MSTQVVRQGQLSGRTVSTQIFRSTRPFTTYGCHMRLVYAPCAYQRLRNAEHRAQGSEDYDNKGKRRLFLGLTAERSALAYVLVLQVRRKQFNHESSPGLAKQCWLAANNPACLGLETARFVFSSPLVYEQGQGVNYSFVATVAYRSVVPH